MALCLIAAPSALAAPTDSPILIRSLSPGVGGDPAAEYVMLQMTVDGQNDLDGEALTFYGPTGNVTDTFTIPSDVPNGQSQRTILLATQQAAAQGGFPAPDFDLGVTEMLDPSGGALCIGGDYPPDCVAWGSFPYALLSGLLNPQRGSADQILSDTLSRPINRPCETWLNPLDDHDSGAGDFFDGVPPPNAPGASEPSPTPPRNNTAPIGGIPCQLDTSFNQVPANPTNDNTPTFAIGETPPEYGATFQCSFEGEPFHDCAGAGNAYGPLADGFYNFRAYAIGYAGPDPTPASWTFEVDTVPPNTTITQVPPEPSSGFSASFSFLSSEPSPTFLCQLEQLGPIQLCTPGKTFFNLSDGPHLFRVWASDQATNQDPTPATHVFNVDTTLGDVFPPDTTITAQPPIQSPRSSAAFAYRSNEPRSTFQCRLDNREFVPCEGSGTIYPALANGSHTFRVKATDRAGNTDSIPDSYTWTVKAPLPRSRLTQAPPGASFLRPGKKTRTLVFAFKADKPNSTFRCRVDKKPFRPCKSPHKVKAKAGRHRFEVYAVDALGNEEATPQRRIFRVIRARAGLFSGS